MTQRNSVAFYSKEKKGQKMYTASSIAKKTGTTVRTVQYYDKIGLFPPTDRTDTGYRLYDDASVRILEEILLYRKAGFSLDEIKNLVGKEDSGKADAIKEHIILLKKRKDSLDEQITVSRVIECFGTEKANEFLDYIRKEEKQ